MDNSEVKLSSWQSYPKILAIGHRDLAKLFEGNVVIEEKVDGSQYSWGNHGGELKIRSHHKDIHLPCDQKIFTAACNKCQELMDAGLLPEGYTYRGEVLAKPKHNCLAYDRCPEGNIVLFDVEMAQNQFMEAYDKAVEARRLGLEPIKNFYYGAGSEINLATIMLLLDNISILGGAKIEGVVVKNYDRYGQDGKVLMGKYVSEKFKEINQKNWKSDNPAQKDILMRLSEKYKTEARWYKAVIHLEEKGELERDPRDIGKLIKEVNLDILEECKEDIKEELFKWAWKNISGGFTRGLPEWFKNQLLGSQFQITDERGKPTEEPKDE